MVHVEQTMQPPVLRSFCTFLNYNSQLEIASYDSQLEIMKVWARGWSARSGAGGAAARPAAVNAV